MLRFAAVVAVAAGAALTASAPAEAQYFGRNKVQYRTFDFRVLRTTHFDVYYYPEEEQAARDAARMAERWYARLTRVLDHEFEERQPLILYATHPHFQQTTTLGGDISEGTGGVTEAFKQRIIMPLANSYAETDHVVGHELVHAFQYDISGFGRAGGGIEEAAQRFSVPGWFVEGMAEYLSVGPVDPHTSMWLRDAALTGRIPTLEDLTYDPRYFPYRWGQAFWAYVGGRWSDAVIGQILKQVGQGVPFPDAFQRILNTPLEEIVEDWGTSIRRTYLPLLAERREAREEARPLITHRDKGGSLNIAPVVSPDGRYIAFLSELENLDVELYLADASTGQVIRRLVHGTAFDAHFGSLRYINSAGTFSPDATRFAFTALRGGEDVLVVLDVRRADILREYRVAGAGELSNPTWSPDGSTVVVSGVHGGVSDLFSVTLASGRSRQLTNDRYADLQPAFSPDGRRIAFVTDRGSTNLETLTYGNYRLALMDAATAEIQVLGGMDEGKNINPAWTRDGTGLYYISDRTGIPNVYRLELADGRVTQVTDLFTGVSGITDLSPAISSATAADRLVFAAYERGGYNIYTLTSPQELAGEPVTPVQYAGAAIPLPALLPPVPRPVEAPYNRVLLALRDPGTGLPDPETQATWQVVPYRPRISLDYLGQPAVGVAASTGPWSRGGLYGGVSGIFSDQLGYHTIYGTVQAQGQVDEVGFSVLYLNQRKRWNWGAVAQRVPYVLGGYREDINADTTEYYSQQVFFRYFDTNVAGIAQYPFSQVQRVEASLGARRIATDMQIREAVYDIQKDEDGNPVGLVGPMDYRQRREPGIAFNMVEASAALVYDNSLGGYTSPFAGQRYRFEVAPTMGGLQYTTATADFRKYFYLRPFTLAFRGFHYGRYGRDEYRIGAIYLGYPFLMRGYSGDSMEDACGRELEENPTGGTECEIYFDELVGTRVAVGNLELRVPLIRPTVVGGSLGLPPVEGIAFVDAGTAWGNVRLPGTLQATRTTATFRRGFDPDSDERGILSSAGVGARINLFGYLILETVYVNAFDRPTGWHWEFALQPGF
ncbi:MAG TPA: hypothetical protein VFQ45_23115 [Longimicrobium sp.]|nr:hypothetical protein [Longimicrobium sp.]